MSEKSVNGAVSFGERLAGSQAFSGLFRDGMALVEETAAYLDGPGRKESKKLSAQRRARLCHRKHAADHAADAARVLAAAASRREGRRDVARPGQQEKTKVKLSIGEHTDEQNIKILPERLRRADRALEGASEQVRRLDATIHAPPGSQRPRPIRSSGSSVCSRRRSSRKAEPNRQPV